MGEQRFKLREPILIDLTSDHWKVQPRGKDGKWVKEGGEARVVLAPRSAPSLMVHEPEPRRTAHPRLPDSFMRKYLVAAKHAPEAAHTVHTMHKAFTELPTEDQRKAVRELREALYGRRSNQADLLPTAALYHVAADTKQKPEIREQAKKEIRLRLNAAKTAHSVTRKAAIESLKAGEAPHHWLGIEPDGATVFDKTLIKLHPAFATAFFSLRGRLRKTPTYKKLHKAKNVAKAKSVEHAKKTGEDVVHRGVNGAMATGAALLASYLGLHIAGMESPLKDIVDAVKEYSDLKPVG